MKRRGNLLVSNVPENKLPKNEDHFHENQDGKSINENTTTPSSMKRKIPDDILYNIFPYLERAEVEKKRLVSSQWNYIISAYSSILPLQRYGKIVYQLAYNRFHWQIPRNDRPPLCIETLSANFLRKIIFGEIFFIPQIESIDNFIETIENKQIKVECINGVFQFAWRRYGDLVIDHKVELIQRMQSILDNFINARVLYIEIDLVRFPDTTLSLDLYEQLNFKKVYDLICFDICLQNQDPNLNYETLEDDLLNFGSKFCSAKQKIEIRIANKLLPEIGAKIIKMFLEHQDPEKMFRHFRFREVYASTFTADVKWYFSSRTKATLKQYNATCENAKCPRRFEYYVVKRNSDEWKMAVDVTNARFVIFRDNLIDAIPHWWLAW